MSSKVSDRTISISFILNILLFATLIGSIISKLDLEKAYKEENRVLNDTLSSWKDKNGKQFSRIAVLEYENTKNFLDLDISNQEVRELQKLVEKYKKDLKNKGSATIIKTETVYDTIKKLSPELAKQIEHLREGIFDSVHNRYISSVFGFRGNNSYFNLMVHNNVSVVIGEEKQGFMKPRRTVVTVSDDNPYSSTKGVRTFSVEGKKVSRFGVGPQIGYGFTEKGSTYYIGVGVNYNLINF